MQTKGKIRDITRTFEGKVIVQFEMPLNALQEVEQLKNLDLDIQVKPGRNKRTLDANAYYWVLAYKLADKLSLKGTRPIGAEEVYREHIKDVGVYAIEPVRDDLVAKITDAWKHNGTGWLVEDMGKSKIPGYTNLKLYVGSSVYDKTEMGKLIDLIIDDCKEYGIETKTPDEIEELKSLWK